MRTPTGQACIQNQTPKTLIPIYSAPGGPGTKRTLISFKLIKVPLAGDLGEAVGSKVDRRSSPHNISY